MAQPRMSITTSSVNDIAAILAIHGDLTAFAGPQLLQAYQQAHATGIRVVILNFCSMDYMNSSGIGVLVTMLIQITKNKQQVFAFGLNDHYQHIFHLTRLSDRIAIYSNELEAIKALRPIALKHQQKRRK